MIWPTATLDELCEINVGRTPSRADPAFWGPGESWLSIADMNQGREISRTKEQITPLAAAGKQVSVGTVLLSFKLSIGKVAKASIPLYTNEAIAALPIKHGVIIEDFLMRALEQSDLADSSNRAAMGATLNKAKLRRVKIPVPPIDEQRRIAAILDHADAIRAKRTRVAAHLDTLAEAIFLDMFGDPDDAKQTVPFGEVASLAGGRNLVSDDATGDSTYRVLKISAVTTGQFKPEESKPLPSGYVPPQQHIVRQGDLLMSRANTTDLVGAVAYVSKPTTNLALPDKVWRFEWRDALSKPTFYHALFRTPAIRRRISQLSSGTGGSMKNVSKAKLESMPIPRIEPTRQAEFAARTQVVSCQRAATRRVIAADNALFASLQARGFRGEL